MYDYILANGIIVDGSGEKPYVSSVAIKGDRIVDIRKTFDQRENVIDVNGLIIAPGFIDIHTHSDGYPLKEELSESKVYQGVTTELAGNCGNSLFPCDANSIETIRAFIKSKFQTTVDRSDWPSYSIKDFAHRIEGRKKSINWASLVGHGTLRAAVMGMENRRPTPKEMELMKRMLDNEIKAGAFGISLGLPYPTGNFSDTDELIELAKVIRDNDAIMTAHIRGESDKIFDAIEEMKVVARESKAHIHISHLKLMGKGQWGKAEKLLTIIKEANKDGLNITCDQYPYNASSTGLSVLVPKWVHEGGVKKMIERLNNLERQKILEEISIEMERRGGADRVYIASTYGKKPMYEGYTIKELADKIDLTKSEVVAKLLTECNGKVSCIYFSMSDEDVLNILKEKDIAIGSDGHAFRYDGSMSTGKPHPRSFGTFPRAIKMIREHQLLSLEDAIYKMTGLSAKIMGLKDRGLIKIGYIADIVIFDREKIKDTSTFDHPFQKPEGIPYVFVSGKPAIYKNMQTKERNGQVILNK
ncbi:MAG: amidohydrolase family protein [Marinisporobacter sp.]|jgi:N-acyl-D-amino-acid deacylase|nr:amidohydrolase family protein [Marinisporobacter sp.]